MLVSCGTGKDAFVVAETIFPPWGTMIVVDVLLAAIAVAASTVVFRRRIDLRRGGALPGVACVLSGLWVVACLHIADFFYKIAQPLDRGASAIASLHFTYSVYVYALSAVLVFVGLILTVVRFTRQLHDIEDRTEALQENESILDSIFENLPFGLLIKNSDHVVERPNRTYLAWYGENIEQMVGHRSEHVEGFQPDDDAHVMNAQEDEVLKTGKLVHRQVERFFVDGKHHHLVQKDGGFRPQGRAMGRPRSAKRGKGRLHRFALFVTEHTVGRVHPHPRLIGQGQTIKTLLQCRRGEIGHGTKVVKAPTV